MIPLLFCRGMFLGSSLVVIYSQLTHQATEQLYYTWGFFTLMYVFAAVLHKMSEKT